jgi:AraC-like DNA-binding protein
MGLWPRSWLWRAPAERITPGSPKGEHDPWGGVAGRVLVWALRFRLAAPGRQPPNLDGRHASCNACIASVPGFQDRDVIAVTTTELSPWQTGGDMFETNMFTRTNAFALLDEGGSVRVDTAELRTDGPRISRVRSTGHLVDLTEETAVTVIVPVSGQLRVRVRAADYRVSPQKLFTFGPTARRTRTEAPRSGGMFHAHALMLSRKVLDDLMQDRLGPEARWTGLPDGLPVGAALSEARRLADLLDYVARQFGDPAPPMSARAGAAVATLVEELLSDLLVRALPALLDDVAPPASWQRVRQAEEIMRARSDEPLSMTELAREIGVGLRSLQLAFLQVRAMGPRDVLLQMRLERARERFLAAHPADTVTRVALDCGFAHLGRFPATYRAAFGELPAETLACARRCRS